MAHVQLLLFLLLLLSLTLMLPQEAESSSDLILRHFGNCLTPASDQGRCIDRSDCEFSNLNVWHASHKLECHSKQRSGLVCCPVEKVSPTLLTRIANSTLSSFSRPPARSSTPVPVAISREFESADELPKHPHCGTAFDFKVYGGVYTGLLEFPWTTLLEYTLENGRKQHICGASFIAQRWLLTAAHCVHEEYVGNGRRLTGARLGEWNQTSDPDCITFSNGRRECAPPHIQASIDRALMHPQFELSNYTHDIALLRLAKPVDWHQHKHVEPVCLPPARGLAADQLEGSAVDVSGWGLTEHNNELSVIKRKAILHVQPLEQCRRSYGQQGYGLIAGQLCASGGINVDSCSGDSGGPLTVEAYTPQRDLLVYLAGIVSYGKKNCGQSDFPGVYTRVSSYMDWIEQTIRDNRS